MSQSMLFALVAVAGCALSVPALRGLFSIREALRCAELESLAAPPYWLATRAFIGLCVALPVLLATASLGVGAWAAALCTGLLAFAVAPTFLAETRRHAAECLRDELALHLDLIALVVESGGSLTAAINVCAERAPQGPLQRAWSRAALELHGGAPWQDVLRAMDQRMGVRAFGTLVSVLRSAERAGIDLGGVLRERARQAAAGRFARAERQARAAPLKLWATMVLCIAPCTLLVLAFPVARLLALIVDR
jgi:tight adherence protein C